MSDATGAPINSVPAGLAEPAFDPNALRVLKERYFAKKADGTTESPREFVWRVASSIAKPEAPYAKNLGRDPDAVVDGVSHAFYDMMVRRDFMPNTPCLVNAGRPLSMLSACFVLPVPDSIEGIFYNLKAMALIQKSGGGCIAGDARVWSTFCGIEPLEALFARTTADGRRGIANGNGVAYDVRDLGIQTMSMDPTTGASGLKPVMHVWKFDVPAAAQMLVRTREGVEVQTSEWHPFMALRGTALAEVRADELREGDVIVGPESPAAFWPWSEYRTVAGLTLNEDTAWLAGFTLGDGSFGRWNGGKRLRWFSGTDDVLERVKTVLASHGVRVRCTTIDPRGQTKSVTTLNQPFVTAFATLCCLPEPGPKDTTIRVPEMIGKSPLSVVHAFLAGLIDSDGTVDADGSVQYTTASEAMAMDLSALVSLLGFQPTVRRKAPHGRGKSPTWTVLLARINRVPELAALVAPYMFAVQRRARLAKARGRESRQLYVPFRVWRDVLVRHGLARSRGQKVGSGRFAAALNRWSCNAGGRVRRADLLAIADGLADYEPNTAELLSRIAVAGQEIRSVTRASSPKQFYDLSVEDWNTYAAGRNGLAMIHNTGFAFSELRHQGAEVESTGKDASGPVSFMKVFNSATDSIKQGGVRRGANMGVLKVDHPDIFAFMRCKKELDAENRALWNRLSDTGRYTAEELAHLKQELLQTQINNFNISIGVTDEFMAAVKADADFALRDPRTKAVDRTVKAREIWDAIVEGAWQNGEPGVLFLDHPEVNPLPGLGPIQATNPCVTGDTWVLTTEGPRLVSELVGVPFDAIVDGQAYPSTGDGFFFKGVKPVFELKTNDGYAIKATADHNIMSISAAGARVWKPLGELQPGDRVVLHDHGGVNEWPGPGNFDEGWLLGSLVGDGHFHKNAKGVYGAVLDFWGEEAGLMAAAASRRIHDNLNVRADSVGSAVASRHEIRLKTRAVFELAAQYGITPEHKALSPQVERASSEFQRGFLQAWFDADGTAGGSLRASYYVRLTSTNAADLEAAQRMLGHLGVPSRIYRNRRYAQSRFLPDGKGGLRAYDCQAYHELSISRAALPRFRDRVGFSQPDKSMRLDTMIAQTTAHVRSATTVESVTSLGLAPVFDCTVPGPHAFSANNIYVKNCGEQFLHGYDSCNLGSINVGHFYDARAKDVDWERLAQTTALSIRFLDNVIDANIYPLDEIEEMVTNNRRVGLGIMGFADLLIQMQIAYGSPEAIAFAGKLMMFIQERAQETSELLARERDDFPNKHLSVWADEPRPRRNAALLSVAPTGTISMIAGCSFGCEPYFGMAYTKHVMKDAEGRPQHLYYVVPLFEEIAKDEGFYSEDLLASIEENRGSVKGLPGVPKHWQDVFTTSADVTVDQHIDMLAAFQKHTDNAVSKTINAPNDDTRENVARAIFRAYESGCKGFTYYRDGSRTEQVVTFSKDNDIAGGNRDIASAEPTVPATAPALAQTSAAAEMDIAALLAKANALLEVK